MIRQPLSLAIASFLMVAAFGASAFGQLAVVSPGGLENVEGNELSDTSLESFRIQFLYQASDFSSIPEGGAFISGQALRADGSETDEGTNTFDHLKITLSTTTATDLSTRFADNLGADATVVFEGSTSISYPVDGPIGGPNPFGADVEFDTLFFYDPSTMGNLLLDALSSSGNDTPGLSKDWHRPAAGELVTVFTVGDHSGEVAEGTSRAIIVRQFTIIPEPSTFILCALGLIGLCFYRQRR